jgi:hypothetical protein
MLTHLPLTEKLVPETATNGEDDLKMSLEDVRVERAKTVERREKSQKAKETGTGKEYMPMPVPGEQKKESVAL